MKNNDIAQRAYILTFNVGDVVVVRHHDDNNGEPFPGNKNRSMRAVRTPAKITGMEDGESPTIHFEDDSGTFSYGMWAICKNDQKA